MKPIIGITGCTGGLGKYLLKENNYLFDCFKGDIRKKKDLKKWILNKQFEAIIHLAAIVPIKLVNKNKVKSRDINFNGTKNLIDLVCKTNLKWFFFASTSHVYKSQKKKLQENSVTKPISYYGKTKLDSEKLIIKKLTKTNIKYCIGRIFSTSNINQKNNYLVPDLIRKIKSSKTTVILKNLNHYRDFISMYEISKIILILFKYRFRGIINIGRGKGILLKDIANLICKKYKKKCKFIDNNKITYLVSNNSKLAKIVNIKKNIKLEKLIF